MVDYALIKWYLESGMYKNLEEFLSNNPKIYCTALYSDFENDFKSNKLKESPTLVPRLYAAFGRLDQALEGWQKVSEMRDEAKAQIACEEAVKILARLEDREKVMANLQWILKRKPEVGMTLFTMIPENLLPSDQMIKHFEND
jgi:tetratricopeptide (TPR) repeat protein